jgi:hypothetical protein
MTLREALEEKKPKPLGIRSEYLENKAVLNSMRSSSPALI